MITPGVSVSKTAGMNPNLLSKMLDSKALAGMDAKMLASMGKEPGC